jgi:SagB-type dehydrogenase family enzyme
LYTVWRLVSSRRYIMDRRAFLIRLAAMSAGFWAVARGGTARAKGLPSDRGTGASGAGQGVIALPPFEKEGSFPLEKALLERKSIRSYDAGRRLSLEEISRLLWAAAGVNRPDGHRTVPSALARYPIDILAALPDGVYQYVPAGHQLKRILADDIRAIIPRQGGFKKAGMIALYVINKDKVPSGKIEWADIEIGCMGQSLFLEATALGLGSCIFAYIAAEKVVEALGLKGNQILRIAQAVGGVK